MKVERKGTVSGDMARISEQELDHAFAEALPDNRDVLALVLAGGRFDHLLQDATLLVEAQAAARPKAKHWWKHWWCKLPSGAESETDIFVVIQAGPERVALHIENKPDDGKLSFRQASDYRRRAAFKANNPAWLSYSDFECILMCPARFAHANEQAVRQFDRVLTYEALAAVIPLFGEALVGQR